MYIFLKTLHIIFLKQSTTKKSCIISIRLRDKNILKLSINFYRNEGHLIIFHFKLNYTYRLRTRISFSNESSLPLSAFLSMTLIAYKLPDSLFSANRTWEKAPLYVLMVMVMHSIQSATKVEVFSCIKAQTENKKEKISNYKLLI